MGLSISRASTLGDAHLLSLVGIAVKILVWLLFSLAIDVVFGKIQLLSFCFAILSPLLLLLAAAAADSRLRRT
jgi:hypothetical protein